jgi:putative membrane protein
VPSDDPSPPVLATPGPTDRELRDIRAGDDRVLMDWVRTGISMISFGFSIYVILTGFRNAPNAADAHPLAQRFSPLDVGLFLCGAGTLSMLMGLGEYMNSLRQLGLHMVRDAWRPSFIIAALLSLAGLFVCFSMLATLF